MATADVESRQNQFPLLRRHFSSSRSSITRECGSKGFVELTPLTALSSSGSLPHYDAVYGDAPTSSSSNYEFLPTKQFQIQTQGLPWLAFPLPLRPDPIHIFSVTPAGDLDELAYVSLRPKRSSGNCSLYRGTDSHGLPLCNTFYRFGPGKPPQMQLLDDGHKATVYGERFEVLSKGCLTRSQVMRTPLGTFEWRYAKKAERRSVKADNLLVLERVMTVFREGGKREERRHPVARLLRNAENRTRGSGRSSAGNGGRLLIDLGEWENDEEQMEAFALASCLMMLKKEVDRRRVHQALIMAGGSGGGG